MPKISIIIPVYGVEKYIERCCVSVYEQTFKDFELILVNDCAKDNSEAIMLAVIDRYKHLGISTTIIKHEVNQGISATRETGTKIATGDYILYLDSDDYIAPDMLEVMLSNADATNADVVYCDYYEVKNGELLYRDQSLPTKDPVEITAAMLRHEIVWSPWNKIFKRSMLLMHDIHWPSGINVGEDLVVIAMVFARATVISHISKGLYFYNRDNVGSYLNGWNQASCNQQLLAVGLVDRLIHEEFKKNSPLINALVQTKLMSRYQILYSLDDALLEMIATTFPETNPHIFSYKKAGLHWKFLMYLITRQHYFFARMLIKLMASIKAIHTQ